MSNNHVIAPKYPVPGHVSNMAQELLSQPIDMSIAKRPVPHSIEEWEKRIADGDAAVAPHVAALLEAAPVVVSERQIAGVVVRDVLPRDEGLLRKEGIVLYFHGGGYTQMAGDFSVVGATELAAEGYHVIAVDYRMPPRNPHPAGLEDGIAVYQELLQNYEPSQIVLRGGSAGGGLAVAVTLAARDRGLPLPVAVVLNTPWVDLDKIGDSYFANEGVDLSLPSYDVLKDAAELYANGLDLKDPMLSPIYADYTPGFPPCLLIAGTRDILLSCTVRLHRTLRKASIEAELHVFEAMWHAFALMGTDEAREAHQETVKFIERHLLVE